MNCETYRMWLSALRFIVRTSPRGFQADLARKVGISRVHLSDVLSGRKGASLFLQEKISLALGYTYEDMVLLGRRILEGKDPLFRIQQILRLPREKRFSEVVRLAGSISGRDVSAGESVKRLYMEGRITEVELLNLLVEQARGVQNADRSHRG